MLDKHQVFMEQLVEAVLDGEGVTDRALRTAIQTAVVAGGDQLTAGESAIPAALIPYLQKVSRHAYRIIDGDVEALKEQGYSEDAIFELTVSAALGAGLGRLERGLAVLARTEGDDEAG